MGFITTVPPKPHGQYGNCKVPFSDGEKNFAIGTVWECDLCGQWWELEKIDNGNQRDPGPFDRWKRVPKQEKINPHPWNVRPSGRPGGYGLTTH